MKQVVLAVFAQLGAAAAVWCFKTGATVLSAMCAVGVVGLLIDYAKHKEQKET